MGLFIQLLVAFLLGMLLMNVYIRIRRGRDGDIDRLHNQIAERDQQLENYKHEVQEHFVGTAEAVDNLTRSYRQVFDQLERDANRLVGENAFRRALSDRQALAEGVPTLALVDESLEPEASGNVIMSPSSQRVLEN